jgi:hypothetical protein
VTLPADLITGFVARHPRLRLLAESVEDAAADVAEEFGPCAVVAAMRAVELAFDVVDGALRVAHHVVALDMWVSAVAGHAARIAIVETTHQLTTRRLADLDRRIRALEAAGDLEGR